MDVARVHILVVDDLVDGADTTAELLSLWGYDAIARYTGAAALESARQRRPACVILDLAMSNMNGFQFASLFHELPHCGSVPLIALSGYTSQAYQASAFDVGIRHYLLKPADPECLKDLLARTLVHAAPAKSVRDPRHRIATESQGPREESLAGGSLACVRFQLQ